MHKLARTRAYVLVLVSIAGEPREVGRCRPTRAAAWADSVARGHGREPFGFPLGVRLVSRREPRQSVSRPDGCCVEFRYVDPRPDAPWFVSLETQED